jgi:hypothetical protein
VVIVFVPIVVAAFLLLHVQRRTRRQGGDLPLSAAIGTGVVLGLVAVFVGPLVGRWLLGGV